jgi:acid phosphatase (class A)
MSSKRLLSPLTGIVLVIACHAAHGQAVASTADGIPRKAAKVRNPNFIDPTLFDLTALLAPPPAQDSTQTRAEVAELHRIESSRTPAEVAAAQFDDTHEDIFIYASVLGPQFRPETLPRTTEFSAHVRNDAGVVDPPLKSLYARPRPYNFDTTLHPVCATNQEGSYPSGHSLNGFLFAYVLAQMVPEKREAIMLRAEQYVHNRMVCEAHYASDIEASRQIATFLVGAMAANPRFQKEFAAAREETRRQLGIAVR